MRADEHTESQILADTPAKKPVSMHENVEVWQDCCCCEAEPYWIEAMEQYENTLTQDQEDTK